MNGKWTFIGGMLAGIAGVFTAAGVAVALDARKDGSGAVEEQDKLALPESEGM